MTITSTVSMQITVRPDGALDVSVSKTFTDDSDGTIGTSTRATTYTPDLDPATLPTPRLRRIATAVWDAPTVAAWNAAHPVVVIP